MEQNHDTIHENLRERVAARLEEKRPIMLATLAQELEASELEVARALPESMRDFVGGNMFEEVWSDFAGWEQATFIMTHLGNVLEVRGKIPAGSFGHGYFNLTGEGALGGHVRADAVAEICFLSLPFMGLESLSVQFFNAEGSVMFSVYVGREKHQLVPAVRSAFLALRDRLCPAGK